MCYWLIFREIFFNQAQRSHLKKIVPARTLIKQAITEIAASASYTMNRC